MPTIQFLGSTVISSSGLGPYANASTSKIDLVSGGATQPVPTIALLDEFYGFRQIEMQVTFDQGVIGFDQSDITATENLPGSSGPGSITEWTINSTSSYRFVWETQDDGGGGDIDFDVNAAVCTGISGGLDNVAAATLNVTIDPE